MRKIVVIGLLVGVASLPRYIGSRVAAAPITQGSIMGTVVDSATTRPLWYAEIVILETGEKVAVQADGSFEFASLPFGDYTLKVGANDHWPRYAKVHVEPGKRREVRVELPFYRATMFAILGVATATVTMDSAPFTTRVAFVRGAEDQLRVIVQRDSTSEWLTVPQSMVSAELLEAIRTLKARITLNAKNKVVEKLAIER